MLQIADPADNLPVIDRLYTREELFEGPHVPDAPDLLAIMRDFTYMTRKGYEFAASRGTLFREPYTKESGSHRLEGILIGAGPDIAGPTALDAFDIQDLTPTILHLQQCPIPRYMDGRLISPFFAPQYLADHEPAFEERPITVRTDVSAAWSDAEEAEITERLKNLGYLG
jgi:predicted AlkP superfamily phosphohydrolase/phosphomutase